jgi:DNA polymerase elongation subunit (family B)
MELNAATRLIASDIEERLKEKMSRYGHATFTGRRDFDAIEKLEREGKLQDYAVSRDVYNANGPEFKSQWKSPRSKTAYEITVSPK